MSKHYLEAELIDLVQRDPAIFQFLQAGSLDGIWYWDLENPEDEWMSPRFWEVFGYDPAEKEHKASAWQDMIHPEDLELALDNFHKHCADPKHPYDQVVRYRHKNGSTVWVRCRGIVIRDAEGNPKRMLGAHNEVTMLKRVEGELEAAVDRLARSNASLENFAAIASHGLQSPLQTITNFMTLLQFSAEDRLTEKENEYISRAIRAARRQSDMIRALLDWSRISTHQLHRREVDTQAMVTEILGELHASLDGAVVVAEGLPPVYADPDLLRRVFQNLVSNAAKFRAEDRAPHIVVAAEQVEDRVVFRVEDNGIGFSAEHAERIFGFGERLHGRTAYEGSGIGLAVCRLVVEEHGGQIRAEPGEVGATFVFSLPRA